MRRTLFLTSALIAAACAAGPMAAAQPAAGDSALRVQAVWGPEQFPIAGVIVDIASCAGGPTLATVTTGDDGTATFTGGAGCYRVAATPMSGCSVDGDHAQQVTTMPGVTPTATFRFRCA
ncbi:prealbumin-like fold domain-containing protein [Nocardia huaxiensis]|uniref:Carboxypeptidase regulatory-like domain-containing protein n=1 Tax=Nocardia huaxiensis TaxID=2755382 RepID=A0A7D6ZF58_9NOCA|nr:prealbumin-like fold domain-containing protein [Nocardia huaxiensis]QLY32118.1 hypothetical protein H0264_07490 [Nocardia huaxiensis]UFS95699.1 prealbumin-like fold domain-containing protein [Nocardia huaxiensis]